MGEEQRRDKVKPEKKRSEKGPIGVLSVAGMYRSGKSYLLNRVLLNRSRGFDVGHTINACTKVSASLIKFSEPGIYQPFELQKCNFLNTSGDNLACGKISAIFHGTFEV